MKTDTFSQWPARWQGPLTKISFEQLLLKTLPEQTWAEGGHVSAFTRLGNLSIEIIVTSVKPSGICHVYLGVLALDESANKLLLFTDGGPATFSPLDELRTSLLCILASHRRRDPLIAKVAPILQELKERIPVLLRVAKKTA